MPLIISQMDHRCAPGDLPGPVVGEVVEGRITWHLRTYRNVRREDSVEEWQSIEIKGCPWCMEVLPTEVRVPEFKDSGR